jgi:hypothetical protein
MLHIYFGELENSLMGISSTFDTTFKEHWIDNPTSRRIIKAIDNSEVIKGNVIESPILGTMPPQWLSGTTKGVLMILFADFMDGKYYCGEYFGDNALPFILEIARTKDVYMTLAHYFDFPKDMDDKIFIDNTNEIVEGYQGYLKEYKKWAVTI